MIQSFFNKIYLHFYQKFFPNTKFCSFCGSKLIIYYDMYNLEFMEYCSGRTICCQYNGDIKSNSRFSAHVYLKKYALHYYYEQNIINVSSVIKKQSSCSEFEYTTIIRTQTQIPYFDFEKYSLKELENKISKYILFT